MKKYHMTFFDSKMNVLASSDSSYEELQQLLNNKNVKRLEKKEFEIEQDGSRKKTYVFQQLFSKQIVWVLEEEI